jgi:predicted DNA-binding transcriptional regulator YafY
VRADRLISMMFLLYERKKITAYELAQELCVSERTIYRDLEALDQLGIPIYTQGGVGGGIGLDENYRLSLTGLSSKDVLALFAGKNVKPLKDLGLDPQTPLLKLFAKLPNSHQDEVERLKQRFYMDTTSWFQAKEEVRFLQALQQAVWQDYRVRMHYQSMEGVGDTREVEPYALVAKANVWYLIAKRSQQEPSFRTYRISRIQALDILPETFLREPDFDLERYWQSSSSNFEHGFMSDIPNVTCELRVTAAYVWFFSYEMDGHYERLNEQDGWVHLRVVFTSMSKAQRMVLGLGTQVQVLAPKELQDSIYENAQTILSWRGHL